MNKVLIIKDLLMEILRIINILVTNNITATIVGGVAVMIVTDIHKRHRIFYRLYCKGLYAILNNMDSEETYVTGIIKTQKILFQLSKTDYPHRFHEKDINKLREYMWALEDLYTKDALNGEPMLTPEEFSENKKKLHHALQQELKLEKKQ